MRLKYLSVILLFFISINQAGEKKVMHYDVTDYIQQDDRIRATLFNINNISGWVYYNGSSGHSPDDREGLFYPRGTAAVGYAEGFVYGGYIRRREIELPSVNGCTYINYMTPGWIITPGTSTSWWEAVDPNDERVRIYRIRADWEELYKSGSSQPFAEDLRHDAAEVFMVPLESVTETQMRSVWEQYRTDWQDWPVDLGAPYYDIDRNGQYTPGLAIDLNKDGIISSGEIEEPGMAYADQVIWCVFNDSQFGTLDRYYPESFGLEIQFSIWGYKNNSLAGDISFRRYRMINKSGVQLDSMFFGLFSDADIGTYTDDLAGCDTLLEMVYAYNGFIQDTRFDLFGLAPPAFGYVLMQGPIIPAPGEFAIFDMAKRMNYRNQKMSSVFIDPSGNSISFPPIADPDGALEWYNALNGYIPTVDLENPTPWYVGNEWGGIPTKYWLSGDPVSSSGDVDGLMYNFPPSDRKFSSHTGPFNMAAGDTQEVIYALVGGLGSNNLSSVGVLKYNVSIARYLHNNLYNTGGAAPVPQMTASAQSRSIVLDWGSLPALPVSIESIVLNGNYKFEGYNLWQLPSAQSDLSEGIRITTFDKTTPPGAIKGPYYDEKSGLILDQVLIYGNNRGIERTFVVDHDYISGEPLIDGKKYTFALTAYYYNGDSGNPFPVSESAPEVVTITAQATNPGYTAAVGDPVIVEHTTGKASGTISATVVNPGKLTGHTYQITYHDPYVNSIGDTVGYGDYWLVTDVTDAEIRYDSRSGIISPIVDGIQIEESIDRTGGLSGWDYTGDRWITGVNWGGSQFYGGLDIGAYIYGSILDENDLVTVRLEFQDQADVDANGFISRGAVYRRDLGYSYAGTGELPIVAYDIDDPDNPRRINICFIEDDREGAPETSANLIWDMGWNGSEFGVNGAREFLFIMKSDYDEGVTYNDINDGTVADVLYVIWPGQRGTRPYLHAEFTMNIYATHHVTEEDVFELTAPGSADIPDRFMVYQNYPNPFNNSTTFRYWVPDRSHVLLVIYNILGQKVATLVDGTQNQGEYFQTWNSGNLASGMYFYRLRVGGQERLRKMVVVK